MPKTNTGQEYSESTPEKLRTFKYFAKYHSNVAKCIINRKGTFKNYVYIDLNSGAGYQPEYSAYGDEVYGSPIIASQQISENITDAKFYFVDKEIDAIKSLQSTIARLNINIAYSPIICDNALVVPQILRQLPRDNLLGLIYLDPNGNQELPINGLRQIYDYKIYSSIDVLMHVSATNLKRWFLNPKAKGKWGEYGLQETIDSIPKQQWFIRHPVNSSYKWTFLYGTNWSSQKELNKIQLYNIKSETGELILKHLIDCKNNSLPDARFPNKYKQLSLPLGI